MKPLKMHKRSGYTLISTLLAICVMLTLASCVVCSFADSRNPDYYTSRDSRELKLWLAERMAIADAEGSSFTVTYYTGKLRLAWTSGVRYAKYDNFYPEKCKLYCGTKGECVYSGQWHTMTPAATYSLTYKTSTQKITVSGQGYLH